MRGVGRHFSLQPPQSVLSPQADLEHYGPPGQDPKRTDVFGKTGGLWSPRGPPGGGLLQEKVRLGPQSSVFRSARPEDPSVLLRKKPASGFLSTTAPRPYGLLFVLSLSLFVISWCNDHRMAAAHTMVGLILLEGQHPSRARWRRIPCRCWSAVPRPPGGGG